MVTINLNLDIPPHTGIQANFIYELPNEIGVRQHPEGNVELCPISGITLPYFLLDYYYVNDIVIPRAYIEALDEFQCISNKLSNFFTTIGNESFEIIASSAALPGMSLIENKGVYANPNNIYRAFLENGNCIALLKRNFLSNGFRFKALGNWYKIVNDVTVIENTQPEQLYKTDVAYGFVIDSQNNVYPINEAGTKY